MRVFCIKDDERVRERERALSQAPPGEPVMRGDTDDREAERLKEPGGPNTRDVHPALAAALWRQTENYTRDTDASTQTLRHSFHIVLMLFNLFKL